MNDRLKKIYYDPKHVAGFSSIKKLSEASGIRRNVVKEWLKAQPTYTLHKPARKKYPTRKYIVHDVDEQWQADLADVTLLASENNGHRFILTVIDIFSRYAWARPLKSKRGSDVAAAFKDIFKEGRIPKRIQTDQGKEFENREVRNLFREHDIELFSVKSAYKAALVERFNRTLKTKLWKYFTANLNQNWLRVLKDVVHTYNSSIHRMTGKKPKNVTADNAHELRRRNSLQRQRLTTRSDIKVGDHVRISKVKSVFEKGYLPTWTEEIFTVASINTKFSPITYKLKDYTGQVIEGSFYRFEIQQVSQTHDVFLVEKVIRSEVRDNEQWCLVKWRGYPSTMNSWVRRSDIMQVTDRHDV